MSDAERDFGEGLTFVNERIFKGMKIVKCITDAGDIVTLYDRVQKQIDSSEIVKGCATHSSS